MKAFTSPLRPDTPSRHGGKITSKDINQHDVLSGRGGKVNAHPGNVQFRNLVNAFKRAYLAPTTKKTEKVRIADRLVMQIRNMNPPGRFLSEEGEDCWYEIGDVKARKKAGQAMRENAKETRQELQERRFHPSIAPSQSKESVALTYPPGHNIHAYGGLPHSYSGDTYLKQNSFLPNHVKMPPPPLTPSQQLIGARGCAFNRPFNPRDSDSTKSEISSISFPMSTSMRSSGEGESSSQSGKSPKVVKSPDHSNMIPLPEEDQQGVAALPTETHPLKSEQQNNTNRFDRQSEFIPRESYLPQTLKPDDGVDAMITTMRQTSMGSFNVPTRSTSLTSSLTGIDVDVTSNPLLKGSSDLTGLLGTDSMNFDSSISSNDKFHSERSLGPKSDFSNSSKIPPAMHFEAEPDQRNQHQSMGDISMAAESVRSSTSSWLQSFKGGSTRTMDDLDMKSFKDPEDIDFSRSKMLSDFTIMSEYSYLDLAEPKDG